MTSSSSGDSSVSQIPAGMLCSCSTFLLQTWVILLGVGWNRHPPLSLSSGKSLDMVRLYQNKVQTCPWGCEGHSTTAVVEWELLTPAKILPLGVWISSEWPGHTFPAGWSIPQSILKCWSVGKDGIECLEQPLSPAQALPPASTSGCWQKMEPICKMSISMEISWEHKKVRAKASGAAEEFFKLHFLPEKSLDGDLLNMTPGCLALPPQMRRQKSELIVSNAFRFNMVWF